MINKKDLIDFINNARREFSVDNDYTMFISISDNYNLSAVVGWQYDGEIYMPCVKIAVLDDLPDYSWAEMPYNPGTSFVFDTITPLFDGTAEYMANYLLDELKAIETAINAGDLTATYLKKYF